MNSSKPTLAIGSDHAGFDLKSRLLSHLLENGYAVHDYGAFGPDRVDYPDVAKALAQAVAAHRFDFGILICGSGQGVNITANKVRGIRSALVWSPESAALSRAHNNANILALPGRFLDVQQGILCVEAFLSTAFEAGRHADRIDKIED
ncbi:MAG: ribose 5-phosphate isomerase B [Bacteroidetes bacterium]|nr:ribose 5-phosphate isomerase B [Bacteroidota bacterium]